MPGLVDAHVHYLEAPVFGRVMIANGVLLVRDMGMPNDYILKLRDELNRGETLGPEMVATGTILDGDPPLIPSISMGIKTPEEGRAAVRQQAAAGVDRHDQGLQPAGQGCLSIWKKQWAGQSEFPDPVWQNWAQMVKGMNEAGVPLMVGTDLMVPGICPGYAVHEEMAIWQEAGIPAADVLRSATLVPARFMGLGDRLGSISEGKSASMVLVRANPLDDIRNAQQIEGVFLRGHYFSRDDLDRLLAEARALARQPAP